MDVQCTHIAPTPTVHDMHCFMSPESLVHVQLQLMENVAVTFPNLVAFAVGHFHVAIPRPRAPFRTVPGSRKCTAVEDGSQRSYRGSNMLGYGPNYREEKKQQCNISSNSSDPKVLGKPTESNLTYLFIV